MSAARHLVITLSNIGDLVMTTPVMEALHESFPGDVLDVVADRRSSALLEATPYIDSILHRDKRAGVQKQWELLKRLRQHRYQSVVDLRTPFWPWLLRSERRCVKPRKTRRVHAVEQHFEALQRLLNKPTPGEQRIYVAKPAAAAATEKLSALPGERWLAMAPGANWPGKRWPTERYQALAKMVAQDFDGLVLLGSGDDTEQAFDAEDVELPMVDLSGSTTLPEVAAVLDRSSAFVGNDSGIGHIAAAMKCPCLTVFGPGEPARYRPWGKQTAIVQAPDSNLNKLAVEPVARALEQLLVAP